MYLLRIPVFAAATDLLPRILLIFFIFVIPALLLLISLIYLHRSKVLHQKMLPALNKLKEDVEALEGQSMENSSGLRNLLAGLDENIASTFDELLEDSRIRYNGRWLPPLEDDLNAESQAPAALLNLCSMKAPILVATIGFFSAVLVYLYLKASTLNYFPGLALIPLIAGLSLAAYLTASGKDLRRSLNLYYARLRKLIARAVPVYNSNNGAALMVENFLSKESELNQSFRTFNETADRLARADFSRGICNSVREVMQREIAPPIRQSSQNLADLAHNLDLRQQNGMEKLAGTFSREVAKSLGDELNPLREELHGLQGLMKSVHGFVRDSVGVLEKSREQNIALNKELSESLRLMTLAKNDLANEMAAISDHLSVMTTTSEKMAASYSGEEASLSQRIQALSNALENSMSTLSRGLTGSTSALQLASQLRSDQETQHRAFSEQLQQLLAQLNEVSQSLRSSSHDFTKESGAYVNKTLKSFDNGLAEVVERLIFTASAIRDAVDALPVALRPGKDI